MIRHIAMQIVFLRRYLLSALTHLCLPQAHPPLEPMGEWVSSVAGDLTVSPNTAQAESVLTNVVSYWWVCLTSPRQAPVSCPRDSINFLKRSKSARTRVDTTPIISPTFSTNPSGS